MIEIDQFQKCAESLKQKKQSENRQKEKQSVPAHSPTPKGLVPPIRYHSSISPEKATKPQGGTISAEDEAREAFILERKAKQRETPRGGKSVSPPLKTLPPPTEHDRYSNFLKQDGAFQPKRLHVLDRPTAMEDRFEKLLAREKAAKSVSPPRSNKENSVTSRMGTKDTPECPIRPAREIPEPSPEFEKRYAEMAKLDKANGFRSSPTATKHNFAKKSIMEQHTARSPPPVAKLTNDKHKERLDRTER